MALPLLVITGSALTAQPEVSPLSVTAATAPVVYVAATTAPSALTVPAVTVNGSAAVLPGL
ncbi:hypothetical protein [Aquimarina sp. 2201CG14-23]|uniref:hypothetical protein n=1 Tax=Aquimarina mycalae TaxID=3040073 RepID=UPI002477DB62|nr:hypothetical protein [Aquimarina sp. 2201CG14-23]MDH7444067.1 hypothetical protein [Aquimarina sp. 2201CG14-23]